MILPPPVSVRNNVGSAANHFLHDGYVCRLDADAFDDTTFTDEFQDNVYQYARQVADDNKYRTVLDVGCGSGFKLLKHFGRRATIGVDLPATVEWCRRQYPYRRWQSTLTGCAADLLICSDVIEHVLYPDTMLKALVAAQPKRIVISTPERDQLCLDTHNGPPRNNHHVREWNYAQFNALLRSQPFTVVQHFVHQGTQIAELTIQE